jgi:hypothetical protein
VYSTTCAIQILCSLHAREEMPSKKKRGQAARGQPASGAGQLLNAVRDGDTAGVTQLLAAGADPNASASVRTPSGKAAQTTALCAAAQHGRLEAALLLLDGGADPSLVSSDGITPLMAAALNGQLEVLRLLLGRGAAVDAVDPTYGTTAFHAACDRNQAKCAEALARAGCDVGLKDKSGQTGRERAEGMGHAAVVTRLRAVVEQQLRAAQAAGPAPAPTTRAADVVGDGGPAVQLVTAAGEGDGAAAARLLWRGGDGGPAVQLVTAAGEGDGAAVARLLAAGADPNALVPGRTPSGEVLQDTALCQASAYGRLEVARLLLDGGADPGLAAGDGFTPCPRRPRAVKRP